MKKIICIIAVVLMIASVVYAQKKAGITAKDLAAMKGTYAGQINFGTFEGGGSSPCTLEILNDAVPIKGKLTIANIPSAVAAGLGMQAGQSVAESDDGTITTQGTIFFTGPAKNFLEVSKAGEKKVKVYYYFRGLKGDGTLTKK